MNVTNKLLAADEPRPVTVYNADAASPFLLVADHAGNLMPRALGRARSRRGGIAAPHRLGYRHRRARPPVGGCARRDAHPAKLFAPGHRLQPAAGCGVVDPGDQRIDGNPRQCRLDETNKAARAREIFRPYHDRIEAELERRRQAGRAAALVALHSFTPVFKGEARPWHAAVLYNRDPRFAHRLIALLERGKGIQGRRKCALHRERRDRLHHPGACRAPRLASRADRDPPGS